MINSLAEVYIGEFLANGDDHILPVENDPQRHKDSGEEEDPLRLVADVLAALATIQIDAEDSAEGGRAVGGVVGSVSEAEEGRVEQEEVSEAILGVSDIPVVGGVLCGLMVAVVMLAWR
jgi:hypothetical protein